jgi:hypothetical protein
MNGRRKYSRKSAPKDTPAQNPLWWEPAPKGTSAPHQWWEYVLMIITVCVVTALKFFVVLMAVLIKDALKGPGPNPGSVKSMAARSPRRRRW